MRRNAGGELILTAEAVTFRKGSKQVLAVPYERMYRVQLLRADRDYAKATYALVLGVGAPGAVPRQIKWQS